MARRRKSFWVTDAETDPFKPGRIVAPFIWGLYCGDNQDYYEFATKDDMLRFIEERRITLVYAHNGGRFDYHFLRDDINSDQPVMVINGRLAKFKIGDCEFRDSLCIFQQTRLADFGGKIEIDYAKLEADVRHLHMDEIRRYLKQDCVLLWDQLKRYFDTYGKSLTQAGACMKVWSQMSGIEPPRQNYSVHMALKPYYYGGRVQCFTEGVRQVDFSVYDVNSAYPFAMLSNHPFSPDLMLSDHLPADNKIGACLIKLDCTSRGALPWRDEDGDLYFPDDEGGARNRMRTYHVTGWELLAGLEHNAISNIHVREVWRAPQTINFREYVEHFYTLRNDYKAKGDKAGNIFCKLFLNSLYGKFGASCEKYAEYVIASEGGEGRWSQQGYLIYKSWGKRSLMCRSPTEEDLNGTGSKWRYYNIATAASVTGFQRAHLWRGLQAVSGALYCDTDSIDALDGSRLPQGSGLGQWKLEMLCDRYAIAGKKLYAKHRKGYPFDYDEKHARGPVSDDRQKNWKVASKGVKLNPEQIERIANGETIEYTPDVPCYTITREAPRFINRKVMRTFKDIAVAA